jgi:hypothetical protein
LFSSLFNPNDSQDQSTFSVKIIFRPSIPDNQDFLQIFENDEHVVDFLVDSNDSPEGLDDQTDCGPFKRLCQFESLFTRDDQTNIHDLREETSIRKVQETQKVNIGTHDSPKYINLGTSCTKEEIDQYTSCLNNSMIFFPILMMI